MWNGNHVSTLHCTHSLFSFSGSFCLFILTSVVHTVRMVVVSCVCAFHAVRMGVFVGGLGVRTVTMLHC